MPPARVGVTRELIDRRLVPTAQCRGAGGRARPRLIDQAAIRRTVAAVLDPAARRAVKHSFRADDDAVGAASVAASQKAVQRAEEPMAGSLCEVIQQARAIAAAVGKRAVELPGCVDCQPRGPGVRAEIMEVVKAGLGTGQA